ncbi:MAG: alanine dehydrogenase [Candidatus Latescibacteria bacterium]|nr:alanine dehydrogenase [Candidatus Latescibacterota bacterium]
MIIGVPKEIKEEEYRVGLLPDGVSILRERGHSILVEKGAGEGAGIKDDQYATNGVEIVRSAKEIFQRADLVVKVKEPQPSEYEFLQEGQILFTYFHFASSRAMTEALLERKITAVAYEMVEENGSLPLLLPMSEIAGRLAPQEGAKYLEKEYGGKGVLLSGATGVSPARVVVIGGGTVGLNSAIISSGMGAEVYILEINLNRLRYLRDILPSNVKLLYSNSENLRKVLKEADLVIGAVLIPGAKAPILLTEEDLKIMEKGTVLVDVSIDQGGCFQTSKPTTHKNPVYLKDGIVHYCVANVPSAVAKTSTYALCYATFPYLLSLTEKGIKALEENSALKKGLCLHKGKITNLVISKVFRD